MSLFPYDGRTPRLTIVATGIGTVDLYNERSAYPFPALAGTREVDVRPTRTAATGPRQTFFVVEDWDGSDESISWSATVTLDQHDKLREMRRANPPEVEVTWRDETFPALLLELSPAPDVLGPSDAEQYGPTEFQASGRLQRTGIAV